MERAGLSHCPWLELSKFVHCSAFLMEGYFAKDVEITSILQIRKLEIYVRHAEYGKPTS